MSSHTAHIAIDFGAESGRVIVGRLDVAGRQLAMHEVHRFRHDMLPLPSGLHWDLTGLWSQTLAGLSKAAQWCREQKLQVASIGADTWGVDWALLGPSGELLGLPHCYRDPRSTPTMEKAVAKLGARQLFEATGTQLLSINTLFQVLARHEADPAAFNQARHMLFMPDLLHYWLTGEVCVEASVASTSQMIDPRTGQWATSLLESLGLPTHMLGSVSPAGTVVGTLRREVADRIGLDSGVKVVAPASHDTASAVAAVPGDASADWCYLSSGTWSLLGVELPGPKIDDATFDIGFTNEGGVGNIRFLKNIAGLWLVQEIRRAYEQRGETYDYAELTQAAADAQPFRTLLDPDHAPLLEAGAMPGKIAAFAKAHGQPEPETVGQFVRCCLESLALTCAQRIDQMASVTGRAIQRVHIIGGGGQNKLLNQMLADATGREIIVGPFEATAAGNVMTQAMGLGRIQGLAGIRDIARGSFATESYHPRDTADWDKAMERFVNLQAVQPV